MLIIDRNHVHEDTAELRNDMQEGFNWTRARITVYYTINSDGTAL